MSRSPAALLLLALWVAGLIGAGAIADRHLSVTSDLRLFLPAPATGEQRLLLEGLGEGPAARVLVVALGGLCLGKLRDANPERARRLFGGMPENLYFHGFTRQIKRKRRARRKFLRAVSRAFGKRSPYMKTTAQPDSFSTRGISVGVCAACPKNGANTPEPGGGSWSGM